MRIIARLLAAVLLGSVLAGASLAFDCDLFQNVASSDVGVGNQSAVDADLNDGDCWTMGSDHGYPTRMWVTRTDAYGPVYVEVTSQAKVDRMIERVVAGETTNLRAFCDGVDLS